MKNTAESTRRSNQLHEIGQNLDRQMDSIPCGLDPAQMKRQQQQTQAILEYLGASRKDWEDWQWQLAHRIQTIEALTQLFSLTDGTLADMQKTAGQFRFAISPYYASLIDPKSPMSNPIGIMSLPDIKELAPAGVLDPSAEECTNPAGSIVRRYPNRVIINITNCCASFCRHCQRKRIIGSQDRMISPNELDASIAYIQEHTEIHDVLITGGDALTLTDGQLRQLLERLRKIPHIDIIRLGSRMPVNLPQRVTEDLAAMLQNFAPIYLNTQFNHPLEITPEAALACKRLADSGVVLGNQMVLLKSVNDDPYTVQRLNKELLRMRVRPYYMFHAKNVSGTMHFQTSVTEGIRILSHLWGNTSGLSVPRYILSAPGGLGKIELTKDSLCRKQGDGFALTTWEGVSVFIPDN